MSSLREINNKNHGRYCTDSIINIKDLDLDSILVYERRYEKIFSFFVLHTKLHTVSLDATDRWIEKRDRDECLSLFHPKEKNERMLDRIKYLFSQKSNNPDVYYHNSMEIGNNSDIGSF